MLMLLRSDILADKCLSIKICFELFEASSPFLFLDLCYLVKPHVGHLSCEDEPTVVIGATVGLFSALGDEADIL
jgi:hypothetical protein